jgi:hypothetical protein
MHPLHQEQETTTHIILKFSYATVLWHLLVQCMRTVAMDAQHLQFAYPAEWWSSMSGLLSKDKLIVAMGCGIYIKSNVEGYSRAPPCLSDNFWNC